MKVRPSCNEATLTFRLRFLFPREVNSRSWIISGRPGASRFHREALSNAAKLEMCKSVQVRIGDPDLTTVLNWSQSVNLTERNMNHRFYLLFYQTTDLKKPTDTFSYLSYVLWNPLLSLKFLIFHPYMLRCFKICILYITLPYQI